MKKRLQKTICYILLFTGFGFLYYKWCQEPDLRFPVFFMPLQNCTVRGAE